MKSLKVQLTTIQSITIWMIPFESFSHFIFDLDDTLVNTREAYGKAQEIALQQIYDKIPNKKFQLLLSELKWFCNIFGSGNVSGYMRAFVTNQHDMGTKEYIAIQQTLEKVYSQTFPGNVVILRGVEIFLKQLISQNKIVLLVSNGKKENQMEKLKITGLDHYFAEEACYISSEFENHQKKPSPFMIEKACVDYRCAKGQTVYFGNIVEDMLAANGAGIKTVFYGPKESLPEDLPFLAKPDYFLQSWDELF